MSPQENVSDPAPASGAKSPFSSVCAEVRVVMDAVRDGRSTPAERTFVATHTQYCAECASEWAFLRATKTAWAKTPMEVPSSSLSARIAAMTYRKPTFAQRVASAFAFLNPAPVRVAIGVAAVAGVSFLVLPRLSVMSESESPVITDSAPSIAREVRTTEAKPTPPVAAVAPIRESAPVVKKVTPPPVNTVAKENPILVAANPPVADSKTDREIVSTGRPTPKSATEQSKPKPKAIQVTLKTPKPVVVKPREPVESVLPDTAPSVAVPTERIVAAATPAPAVPSVDPEPKSPVVTPSVTVAGSTAPETDPDFSDRNSGPVRISLANTNKLLPAPRSGKVVRTSSPTDATYIVSAETKL